MLILLWKWHWMDNEILLNSTLEQSICITAVAGQWRHQGGRPPPSEALLPPLAPLVRRKNGQTQPFLANFWIFAPSESHLAPSMPPTKKKNSGAATFAGTVCHGVHLCTDIWFNLHDNFCTSWALCFYCWSVLLKKMHYKVVHML